MNALELTRRLVRTCLQLPASEALPEDTVLLGGYPEFNSLTITTLIAEVEDALDCTIADEELCAEIFETIGSLAGFIAEKGAPA